MQVRGLWLAARSAVMKKAPRRGRRRQLIGHADAVSSSTDEEFFLSVRLEPSFMTNALATWDWTMPVTDGRTPESVKVLIRQLFKKWAFQKERGDETGYLHYQGRGSLFKKRRFSELKPLFDSLGLSDVRLSPTCTENVGSAFYCLKLDTRVDGPWLDTDVELYIPRQYRLDTLYPWQQQVIDSASNFDSRTVHYVWDPYGSKGKTTIAAICCLLHHGLRIPAVNDHEKLLASVCDILTAKDERQPGPTFIDLPRYMDKKRLHGIYSAIEEIKNGHAYDMRYHFKEWWFDSPPVWVFANTQPVVSALSRDRWKFLTFDSRWPGMLVPFVPGEED